MAPMNIIPNKNLFIVTSALRPTIGIFDYAKRLEQTIETVQSIRSKVPDSLVVITDASVEEVPEQDVQRLSKWCNGFVSWTQDEQIQYFSRHGQKSLAESFLMMKTLVMLKRNPSVSKMLNSVKRIFKISGRYRLNEKFDINDYSADNLYGKYIFKKRMPSWCGRDSLIVTRLWSMCPSLLDDYIATLPNIINTIANEGIDTEHAHFECLNKEHLVEFDYVYVEGQVAQTGEWHYD
jgi:hypothetical protein